MTLAPAFHYSLIVQPTLQNILYFDRYTSKQIEVYVALRPYTTYIVWLADAAAVITQEVAKNNLPFSSGEPTSQQRCSNICFSLYV